MPISIPRPTPNPENLATLIYLLRGEKVLLGEHLAELYGVPVKVLNQAVKRNIDRFPEDFMFQLSQDEMHAVLRSRSQIVLRQAKLGARGKETADVTLKLANGALAERSARTGLSQLAGSESCVCLG